MDTSVFTDKGKIPGDKELLDELKETCELWNLIRNHVHETYPEALDEWNYSGKKFGWGFRIKDKRRVIIYLLPRKGYFKAAFVFGQKATDAIFNSKIADPIKEQLQSAKVYAEGRGIRIDIRDSEIIKDIQYLIAVKLSH